MHKIAFRLGGLDLREPSSLLAVPEHLAELSFEANGPVSVAVLFTNAVDPLADARRWGRALMIGLPNVEIEPHDELVSTSDIAARCDVSAESVRLWAVGKRRKSARPFPRVRYAVGADAGIKMTNLYLWREVLAWVREVLRIDPDEGINYLGKAELRELDKYLDNASIVSRPLKGVLAAGYRDLGVSAWGTVMERTNRDETSIIVASGLGSFARSTAATPLHDVPDEAAAVPAHLERMLA